MANGLPGIGPVEEKSEPKHRWLDIDMIRMAKIVGAAIAIFIMASAGAYEAVRTRHPAVLGNAEVSTQIEVIKGELKAHEAVAVGVEKRVSAIEPVVNKIRDDIADVATETSGLKAEVSNLKESVKEVKEGIKEIKVEQKEIQKGIDEILRKVR